MKTSWRSILLLILVFAAGLTAGLMLSRTHTRHLLSDALSNADSGVVQAMTDHIQELNFDDPTEAAVLAIFEKARAKRLEARSDSMKRLKVIVDETRDELRATLSEEEYKRYRETVEPENPMVKMMLDRISEADQETN